MDPDMILYILIIGISCILLWFADCLIFSLVMTSIMISLFLYNHDLEHKERLEEWIEFRNTHNCILKEMDSSGLFGSTTYAWLCNDGMIYKNRYGK